MESAPASQPLTGKRVLFGITKSNGGGAQAYVLMMALGARRAGAEVSVMAGGAEPIDGAPGLLFKDLRENEIPFIPLSSIQRDIGVSSDWAALKELIAVIKKENPDVLHLNSSKMGLLGALAGRIAGVPKIIFTAHGWPNKEPRSLLWKITAWIGSWLTIFFAHKIICVSENDLRDSPTLFFRDELFLIHNGIDDFARLSREDARAALNERMPDLAKHPQWLVMNAELHPNKGIATAIRAVAELAAHHPDLALIVCGEGDARSELTDLAITLGVSSRVFLPGFIPNVRNYLLAADIFLMPSRKEGLPFAVLEAGLAGLPVVASRIGGIPEIITDHETGLFMPRSNTHILAKAIAFLLSSPEKAVELGTRLREKVLKDFSKEAMVAQTIALY